ncbi:1-acyl-sn-glycerol-3-phosphate acyltransferase [Mumia sp. zg.B21]|uniref:lysophospholipid acyltransferase family protein n=1 Tax=Mumia sp. zg.B21 TaxID=2855447 RepID=UPI001C6ED8E9|nr:lysophospholipid acyltransferase family protein [Mumia sp. zg.B21]MBW9209261.1 1-acyl-sn-glycerol-3-phosphate acyltransferase [Mumia sp. zg.B21]
MRDITYPPVVATAKTLFKLRGWKIQMLGTENIPREGGAVIASNHVGYADFVLDGFPAARRGRLVRFMAKKEAFDHPVGGPVLRSMHHIPVDRSSGAESLEAAVDYCRRGELVGIFPEATISQSFEIKGVKSGAARIAAQAGVPLIPMVLFGTQRITTKGHKPSLPWGLPIVINVGEPQHPTGADPVAETKALKESLERLLDEAIAAYPEPLEGQWWAPARLGGSAPTLEEAARLDAEERAARAARKAEKAQKAAG